MRGGVMADLKLVVMNGIWADWLKHFEAGSSQLRAIESQVRNEISN